VRFQRIHDVVNQKPIPSEIDHLRLTGIQRWAITIAHHSRHGSDAFQTDQDRGGTDVASMKNVVHTGEESWNMVVPEPVGVGNESHGHIVVD
jgi:hypothetical protein